jgi:tetratricopeptide (TPR) repeat protein
MVSKSNYTLVDTRIIKVRASLDSLTNSIYPERLVALMNGEHQSAIISYKAALKDQNSSDEIKLELACSLVGNRELEQANALLQEFQFSDLSPSAKARFLTAKGLIRSHEGTLEEVPQILEEAISLDADFPLPYFSLGKYHQLVEKDSSKALGYLKKASELARLSYGPLIHLITLELAEGNYQSAKTLSSRFIQDFPLNPRTILVYLFTQILTTPYRGRIFLLLAGLSLSIPYWGPALLGVWSLGTISSYILLRKQSTYFVSFSLVTEVWYLMIYLFRSIFLGIFP